MQIPSIAAVHLVVLKVVYIWQQHGPLERHALIAVLTRFLTPIVIIAVHACLSVVVTVLLQAGVCACVIVVLCQEASKGHTLLLNT